ncbi:MAG: Dabb family protein [Planctomycetes bacterium]|nr:Dabb family protein [Planctomycetota bacterium]
MLGHMVYFTLKDNSEEASRRLIDSCKEHLSGHPGTVLFAAGTRVPDLDREVNDKEFHVALQLVFENREAQDNYQVHQRHETFIETNRDSWAKVRVFDSDLE